MRIVSKVKISTILYSLTLGVLLNLGSNFSVAQIKLETLETQIKPSLIKAVFRDHKDYLWIGNNSLGLMKYDGYHVRQYLSNENDSFSISNNCITDVLEDKSHNLWVGTKNGLNKYNDTTDNFIRYNFNDSHLNYDKKNHINDLHLDKNEDLWILTKNGLYKLNRDDQFTCYQISDSSDENNFTGMSQDNEKNYWVVTVNNGIYKFKPETGDFIHFRDSSINGSFKFEKKLLIDNNNKFWIGTQGFGLSVFLPISGTFKYLPEKRHGEYINGSEIGDLALWNDTTLLAAVDQGGINLINTNSGSINHIKTHDKKFGELSSNGILCFHIDNEGILWVGTSRGGINYYNPKKHNFEVYSSAKYYSELKQGDFLLPMYNITSCFFEDSRNNIWVGTDGGGLSIFNRKTKKFKTIIHEPLNNNSISSNVIRGIVEDATGNIYIANLFGRINKYDSKTGKIYPWETNLSFKKGAKWKNIWSIYFDSKERFWISGTQGDINLFNKHGVLLKKYFFKSKPFLSFQMVSFKESLNSEIFINTPEGIAKFNEEKHKFENMIIQEGVNTFHIDHNNFFWLGTDKKGLIKYNKNGRRIGHYLIKNGLTDNCVYAIQEVDNCLWISTNNGLSYLNTTTNEIKNFSTNDGLPNNQFFIQSSLKTKDNVVYFGGENGITIIKPESLRRNNRELPVYINKFYLNNKLISFKDRNSPLSKPVKFIKELKLKHYQRILAFEFLAISYTYPRQTKYKYILENYDTECTYVDAQNNKAIYTNLDPGEYVFKVTASNNDGIWTSTPAQIKITISPPFWKTTWFIILEIAVIVLIILTLMLLRSKKLIKDKQILKRKVENRTQTIQKQALELSKKNLSLEEQKEELKQQRDELALHHEQLEQLVRKRTKDMQAAKEKAEKSDRLKSYFLANMSHEIRTPLNAVVGFSALLNEPDTTNKQREVFINHITTNADSLLYLIEDILDFSLIEADQIKLNIYEFGLNNFVQSIYSSFLINNKNENVKIELDNKVRLKNYVIKSDEVRVQQIISNLIGNALKFTKKGSVKIEVDKKTSHFIFSIIDTGHGIPKAEKEAIFDQFVRLEEDQKMAKRGIGLGLSISKRLSILLGGQLSVSSELKKGSTFTLKIPC